MKRGGSLSFLVGTISNVLVMEIGWTDVGSGGYILVSCAHINTSFILVCEILAIFISSVFNFGHFWSVIQNINGSVLISTSDTTFLAHLTHVSYCRH